VATAVTAVTPAPVVTTAPPVAPASDVSAKAAEIMSDVADAAAARFGDVDLHGFQLTGQILERLPLERAKALADQWWDAWTSTPPKRAMLVMYEHELARGGYMRPPSPPLAAPAEIAELERLAAELGSSAEGFWAKAKTNGWTKERGVLPLEHAKAAFERLVQAKAARDKAKAAA